MRRNTATIILSAAVAIIGAMLAWRAHGTTERTQAAAAVLERDRLRLAAEVKSLERQIEEARRAPSGTVAGAERVGHGGAEGGQNTMPPTAFVRQIPPDNTEMQARALHTLHAGLALKYGALYRSLGLDGDGVAKFESLMAEHEGRKIDIRTTERTVPLDPATAVAVDAITSDGRPTKILVDASIAALRQEEEARFKAAQTALLGAAGYEQLQEFERTGESRGFVSELVGNLALGSAPLSAAQGWQLMQALQEGSFTVKLGPENTNWDAILGRAQSFLTPAQFDEMKSLAAKAKLQVDRNELSRLIRSTKR